MKRLRYCLIAAIGSGVLMLASTGAIAQEADAAPDRSGFTLLLSLGVGNQINEPMDETAVGLGGLNLGIGGFLNPDLALWFRISGTNVSFSPEGASEDTRVVSAGGLLGVQYWANDSFNLEAGAGVGFANADPGDREQGFSMMLGAAWSFYHKGVTSFQVGVEYAPVFLDAGNIHNIGIVFGWQLL